MRTECFSLFADYFQFYLQDETVDGNLADSWTQEAVDRLLAVTPGTVGVGTVRNMEVPVVVELHDLEPSRDLDRWDHVVECSLNIPSGRIVIAGCTDFFPDAARIEVKPGSYRARVLYRGLDTLSEDGLDGNDQYVVVLWPGPPCDVIVLKQWPGETAR